MITNLRAAIISRYGPGQQNTVADRCRINRGKLSQYATGTCTIPAHHLLVLAETLECSPRDLVGYRELNALR